MKRRFLSIFLPFMSAENVASQMKTFGERPDIMKARTEAGADVASTTVISPIGEDWLPN